MRLLRILGLVLAACAAIAAQDARPAGPLSDCDRLHTAAACEVSKADLKLGRAEFERGLRLRKGNQLSAAFDAFTNATEAVPKNLEYLTAREIVRQQLVFDHVQAGNDLMEKKQTVAAAAEFREAARLDPANTFVEQRLHDALGDTRAAARSPMKIVADNFGGEVQLAPKAERHDFHLRGDTKSIVTNIANVYGIRAIFDDSVQPRPLTMDLGGATFQQAMTAAALLSRTFWVPLSSTEILVAADSPAQRQELERMIARTFYFQDVSAITELTDILNVFRTIFDVRFGVQQPSQNSMVVRAPQRTMDALIQFVEAQQAARPQVMLDMEVFEVNQAMMRSFGLQMPLQWSMINLTSGALALLKNGNVQNLINQLIASGGINQAGNTAIGALLAQLQSQQSNPLLQNPFGTFGGGFTRFAVPFSPANVKFSLNESRVQRIQHVNLRAAQGIAATLRIGSRYPVLNASFAPIYNTPQIAQVIQNQSFQAPFPSFNFEDLGLTLKATPAIHGTSEVTLDIDLQMKTLGSQSFNGVPVIGDREYKGTIRIPDGEAGIVTGIIERSEQQSLMGIPGIARIPVIGTATSSHDKQVSDTELLIVITPHIMRAQMARSPEIVAPPVR